MQKFRDLFLLQVMYCSLNNLYMKILNCFEFALLLSTELRK